MLVLVLMMAVAMALADQKYPSKWDNMDVEPILKNDRLFMTYFRCMMDQGRCSPEAAEIKKIIPEALQDSCSKCTEKQKLNMDKVMTYIYHKRPEMFKQIEQKFDPKGNYRKTNFEKDDAT